MVIKRDRYVARVASDVDHALVQWLKTLVAFQQTGTGMASQTPIGIEINFRNNSLNICERNRLIRMQQITDQKARPCVARPRIGNREPVIWKPRQASPRHELPGQ